MAWHCRFLIAGLVLAGAPLARAPHAHAQTTEQIIVYGTLPESDLGIPADKVPGMLQSLRADQITAARGATILDALGSRVAGVGLSDLQGNSMFEDVRYHGFEASPLQGVAQGLAVYQNGVRLNEAFGDTVNWDAIPETAIARMDVWSSNPVFGLNALGGAINLVMKNGFTWNGAEASVQGGSYGHAMGTMQYGMSDGNFGFYAAAEGVTDDGWRLHSGSKLARLYADAGFRFGTSEFHVVASGAQSGLGVVGPTPVELIERSLDAVYTWPQTTQNRVGSLALKGKIGLDANWQIETNAYVRALRQHHVDGNDANFESCSTRSSYGGDICLQDDDFGTPPGGKTTAYRNQFVIMNAVGQVFPYQPNISYGTIDRTATDTTTFGGTLQATGTMRPFGFTDHLTAGGSVDHSLIGFRSSSTLGSIYPDIEVALNPSLPGSGYVVHTLGALGYEPVDLAGTTNYYGLYAVDSLDLATALTVTAGGRLNIAEIAARDRSGLAPELAGSHSYSHLNPLAGLSYRVIEGVSFYGNYSQSNRAPTPLELDCANRNLPCLLEGALVSDPALKQVVAQNYEVGLRGGTGGLKWSANLFRTDSDDDIVALASTIQGHGYYTNVPLTRRQGVDLNGSYEAERWSVHASYSYLDATYQFTGALASPNNPAADDNGNVTVTPGRHIPLNPMHQFRAGGDVVLIDGLSIGADLIATGSQYFAGDNANQNPKLPGYWIVNLRGSYEFARNWKVFGVVNNLFNRHDAAYGTFFSPDDTVGLFKTPLVDPRTLTVEQPISFQIGVSVRF